MNSVGELQQLMEMLSEKQKICCEEQGTVKKTLIRGSGIDPELAKISLWFCDKEKEHRLDQAYNRSLLRLTRISKASVEVWGREIDTDEVILMCTPSQFKWNHAEGEVGLILTLEALYSMYIRIMGHLLSMIKQWSGVTIDLGHH